MKLKHINIFLYISLFINVFLGIYIAGSQPVWEREHMDDIDRGSELCDAEMAKRIADIAYRNHSFWSLWDDIEWYDIECDQRVLFNEGSYEWLVIYTPILPANNGMELDLLYGTKIEAVRKDTGYCTLHLSLESIDGFYCDKEMAMELADIYCKRFSQKPYWSLSNDVEYDCEVVYSEENVEWIVILIPILPEEEKVTWMDAGEDCPTGIIGVRKDIGWCTSYDSLDSIPWFGCNEEIAIQLAEAKYKRCYEEPFWITQSKVRYDCDVFFNKGSYEWIIVYTPILEKWEEGTAGGEEYPVKIAGVRNDSGYCTFYESLEDIPGFQGR